MQKMKTINGVFILEKPIYFLLLVFYTCLLFSVSFSLSYIIVLNIIQYNSDDEANMTTNIYI